MASISYGIPEDSTLSRQNWNIKDFSNNQSSSSDYETLVLSSEVYGIKHKTLHKDDMKIEDLSYNFMQTKLSPILDRNNKVDQDKNIFALAEEMSFSEDDITFLRNCYAGGGDPAGDFLSTMVTEQPDMLVVELRYCLQTDGLPPKALETIASYANDSALDDILPLHMDKLALKLTTHGKTKYNWEYVAEKFGYADRIPLFKAAIRRNNITSPTMALMDLIKTKKPGTKMIDFIHFLEKIKNDEAAEIVKIQVGVQCKP